MEITEIFESFYKQFERLDLAEDNFMETLKENAEMKKQYENWCDEMGYSVRKGFKSYFMNKSDSESIWDSFYPNREELDEYDF